MRHGKRDTMALGQECQFPIMVEPRQSRSNGIAKAFHWGEESKPQILQAHMRGDVMQYWLVFRTQRSNSERCPIAQPLPQAHQFEGAGPVVKGTGLGYPGGGPRR